jgi:hypothetical protein
MSGNVVGGAALATALGVAYYISNQMINPIKEDLDKTIQEVCDLKKKLDIVDVNNNNITEIAQLIKQHSELIKKIIIDQRESTKYLVSTISDIQIKLFNISGVKTKPLPKTMMSLINLNNVNRPKQYTHTQSQPLTDLNDL